MAEILNAIKVGLKPVAMQADPLANKPMGRPWQLPPKDLAIGDANERFVALILDVNVRRGMVAEV